MTLQAEASESILPPQGSAQGQKPSSPQRTLPEMSIEPAPTSTSSSFTRPESQDTISQPLQEPHYLKQEYSPSSADPLQSQSGAMESTHDQEEDGHDSEMESAAQEGDDDDEDEEEEEEDEDDEDEDLSENDEDQEQQHRENDTSKRSRRSKRNGNDSNTRNEKNEIGNELSLSSDEDEEDEVGSSHPNEDEYSNLPEETLCRWKDCGKVLPSIAALVVHLSDEHIGWKKTAYTCEWEGCSRRPIAQTTRFALISHMRSHTKHKPYDCPVPECDKSFSRSDAMAKHLKCQHGDVPERFTGRKSRGRYTMKDPAASSTLLHTSSFGARKRRRDEYSKSDAETLSSTPAKLRKLGSASEDRHHDYAKHSDQLLLERLNLSGRSRRYKGQQQEKSGFHENNHEEDDDDGTDDSDFAVDNGQTPRERYGILKAKFQYIHNERESLEAEYDDLKKKLTRLRVERELLLDALLASEEQHQDLALQDIEDSD